MTRSIHAVFFVSTVCGFSALGLEVKPCVGEALEVLHKMDPSGYRNYLEISDQDRERWFTAFIDCNSIPVSLATAVHESTHFLDLTRGNFSLSGGQQLPMEDGTQTFFAPKEIAPVLEADDIYVKTYILGKSSSKDAFLILLDELNAYSRDTQTSLNLISLYPSGMSSGTQDALLALMNFLRLYVYVAQVKFPDTWSGLKSSKISNIIKTLWVQAESILGKACQYPQLASTRGQEYLRQLYGDENRSIAISEILGRQIARPKTCTM